MKKITFLLAFLLVLGSQSYAQISIGSGTLTNMAIPIEPYYGYSYSEVIYLASDIGASGNITGVKYYATSATTLTNSSSWTVYIGHTTKSTYSSNTDWITSTGLTQVFTGTATISSGEVLITFSSPFAYNGIDNLVIAVDENQSSYDGGSHDFYCSTTAGSSAYQALAYRSDGTNPDPTAPPFASYRRANIANIELQGIVVSCPAPDTLGVTSLTATGATLGWSELGSATSWEVEYGVSGFSLGTGNDTLMGLNPLPVTGLLPGTNYQFYVRAVCGAADSSSWTGPMSFLTPCLSALSGIYTVDPSSPLSTTNYHKVDSLVNDMNTCGISGAVTINVASGSGPYTEMWNIGNISGASAVNTITFNGNGVIINKAAGKNHFVRLDGTKHLTIDGFNFVNQTPATAMFGIQMKNGCDSIAISNNTIDIGMNYTSSFSGGIVMSNSNTSATTGGDNANNVLITGNEIIGGYYGIRINGTSTANKTIGHDINNNNIHDFYFYGLYVNYGDSLFVKSNDISRATRTIGTTFYGMYFNYTTHVEIMSNKVHDVGAAASTVYGMQFRYSANTVGSESEIVNNAFYNLKGSSTAYGIYLYGTKSNINLYHNTIDLETAGSSTRYGIYNTTTTTDVNIKNNLIQIAGAGTGTAYGLYYSTTSVTLITDNNNVFVNSSGTNYYGRWSSNQATLAGFQTASTQAANSNEIDPVFTDVAVGNISPLSMAMDNMGAVLGVTSDIDGATRSTSTPDVGAVEFTGIAGDLALLEIKLATSDSCYSNTDTAFAKISNILATSSDFSVNNLTIVWSVTGPVNTIDSMIVNTGSLAGNSDTVFYITSIDMSIPGDYTVSAYIRPNTVNPIAANDSIMNGFTETIQNILVVSPDSVTVTSPLGTEITSQSPFYPAGGFYFSELIQYKASTGAPLGGYPSYSNEDDNVEITGVPNSDLDGVTVEVWTNAALLKSFTFTSGTLLSGAGTAFIGFGSASGSPANNYYTTGGPSNSTFSSMAVGYILKSSSGLIIDAVASNSYSFPAASGVTVTDWSGTVASSSGTNGMRLQGPDLNNSTGWLVSSNTIRQDPNVLNANVVLPSSAAVVGLTWDSAGTTVGTDPNYWAGSYTADGVYTYVLTYVNSCGTYVDSAVVTVDLAKAAIATVTNVNCYSGADGTATASVTGGDSPYSYAWSNGDSTIMADSLGTGSVTVTVTDANGWSSTASVTITEPSTPLTASTSSTPSTCGVPSGTATALATGGTAPYAYMWPNGQTTATATGLIGGSYLVTVTDTNLCSTTAPVTVSDIGAPIITIAIDSIVACYGDSSGVVTATAIGGTTPYNYAWSSGGSNAMENGLAVGMYTVVLTDSSGCVASKSVTMTQNTPLLAIVTGSTNPLCNGDATGTATSIAGGGVAPYAYAWSNGDMIANAAGLAAGSHSLTVTDAAGCMQSTSVSVTQPNPLMGAFVNTIDVSCNGGSNGAVGMLNSGGTAPYSMSWSDGSTAASTSGLSAGFVSVTVTDANSCVMMDSVNITQPTAVTSTATVTSNVLCNGGTTGMASVSASGGTLPLVYAWSNGSGGSLANGLAAGTYSVIVSDGNNCQSTSSVTVTEPTAIVLSVSGTDVSCFGMNDGSAMATATGGTAPYAYSWNTGGTSSNLSSLGMGTYSVSLMDANGCTTSDMTSIAEPAAIIVSLGGDVTLCDGESVSLDAGAGFASYNWTTADTTATITVSSASLGAGSTSIGVVVMNSGGCSGMDSIVVTVGDPVFTTVIGTDELCMYEIGDLDAGPGFTSYEWSNSSTSQLIKVYPSDMTVGTNTFMVTVTDNLGCEGISSFDVELHPEVVFNLPSDTNVWKEPVFTIMADSGYASYLWNTSEVTQSINITSGGTYWCVVTDSVTGCEGNDEIVIEFILGASSMEVAEMKLYPNPASEFIKLEFKNFNVKGNVEIELLSITGQLVRGFNVDVSATNGTQVIDVSNLAVGTYFVTFDYENEHVVKQFTIK